MRLILISSFAAALAACAAQSSDTSTTTWARENQACADIGIDPDSDIFAKCVTNLHNSLWAEQNFERN